MADSLTYAEAGVDIDKANRFVEQIKSIAKQTSRTGVMGEIGGFGGLFSLNVTNMERPVLVSSTDGVGTKLKIAFMLDRHDTVGIDLVAMSVNDIVVQGAKPIFFLDYFSTGELCSETAVEVVKGIGEGCRQAGCALIGGETAEMPGMYPPGEYDLAGFAVGLVDNDKIVDGSEIRVGHRLIGIPSSGLHSNGFSLVRKICFDRLKLAIDAHVPELQGAVGEELLKPTRIYAQLIQNMLKMMPIHGMAHITGGGIAENVIRILPQACSVALYRDSWSVPPIFSFLAEAGDVAPEEMLRTFNNGIGLVAVVPEDATQEALDRMAAMEEAVFLIGEVVERKADEPRMAWVDHG